VLTRATRPITIGPLHAPSRVLMAAMEVAMEDRGRVDDRYVSFLARRAGTGLAWITTGGVAVRGDGLTSPAQLRLDDDDAIPGFTRLADAVHAEGGRLVVQLTHAGRQTLADTIGTDPIAPSPIPCPVMRQPPRELPAHEMPDLVEAFAAAARRAAEAGADGVELHMAHGYLLNAFLSPASNHRDDAFGGDTDRRCRLPVEVIAAVREACPALAVIVRISADEQVPGGIDVDEAERIAVRLEAAGAHAIHVSACTYGSLEWNIPIYLLPEAGFRPLAARIREAVDVPVIAVGRLHTPELIEDVLRTGDADLVAVGRPLIADPDFATHLREGTAPRPCLKCNRCIHSIAYGPVSCTVNPLAMLGDRPLQVPAMFGRVLVVGGGAAGMTTALLASQLGHAVRLLERSDRLGGQLDVAGRGQHKQPVAALKLHLAEALAAAPVDVRLGTAVDADEVARYDPDAVIVATGSHQPPMTMPGEAAFPVLTVDEALRAPAPPAGLSVVLGAGAAGMEAAHALLGLGARVALLEKRPRIGIGLIPHVRYHLQRLLKETDTEVLTRVHDLKASGDSLHVYQRRATRILDGVGQVVVATGREANRLDPAITSGSRATVYTVGDALRPGSILEALEAARRVVEQLGQEP